MSVKHTCSAQNEWESNVKSGEYHWPADSSYNSNKIRVKKYQKESIITCKWV